MEKEVMAKVTGIVKRNGMFDKARKDILEKVLKDEGMQTLKQQCEKLVKDVFNRGKGRPRDEMREDLRKRMRTGVVATETLNDFVEECLKSDGLAPDTLEGIARAELGLPPLNTNTDVVDMELSDGASPADTASTKSTEIPINHGEDFISVKHLDGSEWERLDKRSQ
ncbi:hypothetical protein AAVH_00677 [Aphelenchoides avenae]|nr:hypothetical protein AAVH_00677 [Aphelenchus avenae]